MPSLPSLRGRGSASNPKNRFEAIERVPEPPEHSDDVSSPDTQFYPDHSKSIIAYNDSPDVGFDASINPYRGCEHGCVYCYARPTHEYLGFSAGLDFETKIMVKEDAPELLRSELSSPKWKPQLVALSGNTDCYQPIEKQKRLTRRCLEVLLEFRNPVVIVTKNYLVTRDIDILSELARFDCIGVTISLTTLDFKLSSLLEPRASRPAGRLSPGADDSRPYRFGGSCDWRGRRESRRDVFRLHRLTFALCRKGLIRTVARSTLSREEKQDSQPRARNPRRQTQRSEFQNAHARRRDLCRANGKLVSVSAEKIRHY